MYVIFSDMAWQTWKDFKEWESAATYYRQNLVTNMLRINNSDTNTTKIEASFSDGCQNHETIIQQSSRT